MTTNGTITINDTLSIERKPDGLAISRLNGGRVQVDLSEVRFLVSTLARIVAEQATGRTLGDISHAAITGWIAGVLIDNQVRIEQLTAENAKKTREIEGAFKWVQSLQDELAEWQQAAQEAQEVQTSPQPSLDPEARAPGIPIVADLRMVNGKWRMVPRDHPALIRVDPEAARLRDELES